MPIGHDHGHGVEPGRPIVHRIVGEKDAALDRASTAGLQVLTGRFSVHKYEQEPTPERLYEVVECPPNLFLTAGVTQLWNLVTVSATTPHLDVDNAHLAVGNSAQSADVDDTDLVGASTFRRKVSDQPVVSGRQVTFSAEYGTGDANFEWLEVGAGWAASGSDTLLSRTAIAAPGLGTKVNTAVWILNWTLSISATPA